MSLIQKIGLGTAQWGMSYGIANRNGRPDTVEIGMMLKQARQAGVSLADTAHVYGEAEQVLGHLDVKSQGFRVITKTLSLETDSFTDQDVHTVSLAFSASLQRLRSKCVDGLLVHNAENLLVPGGERLWEWLQTLKADHLVSAIGVSVYHTEQLLKILDHFEIDIVQLPFNIYDQRFVQSGILHDLKSSGIEVHARSAFLQGLLLLPSEQLPPYFDSIREHQKRLHHRLLGESGTLLGPILSFCLRQPDIDYAIVGCETLAQLEEVLRVAEACHEHIRDSTGFALENRDILDPSRWVI